MNCFVFILIGLQLIRLISVMTPKQIILYTAYALFFTLAMIVIRLIWIYSRSGIAYRKALAIQKSQPMSSNFARGCHQSGGRACAALSRLRPWPCLSFQTVHLLREDVVIFSLL